MTSSYSGGGGYLDGTGSRALRVVVDDLEDRRVCLRVAGELDLATAEELGRTLAQALDSNDAVVLDLSEVTFIDSTGLAAIIAAVNRANGNGAVLQIATPLPNQPHRLLELTGVMSRLSFTPVPPREQRWPGGPR